MNIIFVSQCTKRALRTTRRILDQFGERKGDCVWHAQLTEAALLAVRKLLAASARKNTAVCCHLVRRVGGTQVKWTVGAASAFDREGNVPTRRAASKMLWRYGESTWVSHRLVRDVATFSALTHDLGKATAFFQGKLRGTETTPNVIRHEWASARLLQAFALNGTALAPGVPDASPQGDLTWLELAARPADWGDAWTRRLVTDLLLCSPAPQEDRRTLVSSLAQLPLAKLATWLTLTHHRLPQLAVPSGNEGDEAARRAKPEEVQAQHVAGWESLAGPGWNEPRAAADGAFVDKPSWSFPKGLPTTHAEWARDFARVARRLSSEMEKPLRSSLCENPFVAHVSRLCLMLADHSYSSLVGADKRRVRVKATEKAVWANTTADGRCNQTLDEHLLGVSRLAASIAQLLPALPSAVPGLQSGEQELRSATPNEKFSWQNDAARLAETCAAPSRDAGAFVINAASTGRGKTLANARILAGFCPDGRVRGTFAMGLRALTLQTGLALRSKLGLAEDDLVIRVGEEARELFSYGIARREAAERGSESGAELAEEAYIHGAQFVDVECLPVLKHLGKAAGTFVAAPFAVCTIDHLTPATEGVRGGRQIAPMLRLMSADLVLDEPDDFGLEDLPALARVVHWAGLMGARVVLSSATLAPSMVSGLFQAYKTGRAAFNAATSGTAEAQLPVCLWVDEFDAGSLQPTSAAEFEAEHAKRMKARAASISAQESADGARHRGALKAPAGWSGLAPEWVDSQETLAQWTLDAVRWLHDQHAQRPAAGGPRVSFGLVRVANIRSLVDMARFWMQQAAQLPENYRLHLCPYHSRFPLYLRSALERDLDAVLQRHQEQAVFQHPKVRIALEREPDKEHIFVVLGSPVTEVGRDHDYDWAVPEPSSMRSVIQLTGRVRRHRSAKPGAPNVLVMPLNFRDLRGRKGKQGEPQPVYHSPGFESKSDARFQLKTYGSAQVFRERTEISVINATARICEDGGLRGVGAVAGKSIRFLSDLEHLRTRDTLLSRTAPRATGRSRAVPLPGLNGATWWAQSTATWSGLMQQATPFRRSTTPETTLALLPDEHGELHPHYMGDEIGLGPRRPLGQVEQENWRKAGGLDPQAAQIAYWLTQDCEVELTALAEHFGTTPLACAKRFATVTVLRDGPWAWHPSCGVVDWSASME